MELKRNLTVWDIFCIATGAMISSGLFVLPALAYRYGCPGPRGLKDAYSRVRP